jgi:hypothetical protein
MEGLAIFNVKVNNEERKAIDLVSLKNLIEEQKLRTSMLNIDPNMIEENETVMKYIAKSAIDTLAIIENIVDRSLGIIPTEDEETNTEPEESSEPTEKVKTEIVKEKPKPVVDEEKDEIVI